MSPLAGGVLKASALVLRIRQKPDVLHVVTYHGRKVLFRREDEMALREVLVNQEYSFLAERLSAIHAPIILDVGAHIGTFAIWVLTVNPQARLLSIEADPATYQLIKANSDALAKQGMKWGYCTAQPQNATNRRFVCLTADRL